MSSTTSGLDSPRQLRRAELASRRRHPAGREVVHTGPLPVSYYVIAIVMAILVPLGLVMVLSSSSITQFQAGNSPWRYFQRQVIWAFAGLFVMWVALRMPLRRIRMFCRSFWLLSMGLMLVPFVPGIGVSVRGARAWVGIGPLVFQPSEFLKLAVLLVVADVITRRGSRMGELKQVMLPCLTVIGLAAFMMVAQNDLGSAIVLGSIGLSVLFLAGAPLLPMFGVSAGLSGAAVAFALSTPYRRQRWTSFLDLMNSREGDGYQTWQSILSISNGGLTGRGVGAGSGKWGYVPLAHSDFIFAVLAEELGFIGVFAVLGAYVALIWAGTLVALACKDRFGSLVAGGVVCWIGIQTVINVGGVVGLMPVTGLTLPFLSYGGSSLLSMMAAGGLLLNVARNGR
ncbi:MAG: putative lipid II flippase FtsW [Actinomycetota bacterium]